MSPYFKIDVNINLETNRVGDANVLRQTHIKILDDDKCKEILSANGIEDNHFICAGHLHERIDACSVSSSSMVLRTTLLTIYLISFIVKTVARVDII